MNDLRQTLRNVFLKESDDSGLFEMISSELRQNARQLGINYDDSVVVNTKRTLKSINEIKDMSENRFQWAGFGSSWLDWIATEMPEWLANNFYVLKIDYSKIITVSNQKDIDDFETKWVSNPETVKDHAIDYKKIYDAAFTGISFKPYNRNWSYSKEREKKGLSYIISWYNSIDVPSIVILNKKAIKGIKLLLDASELIADYK